jgi:hypothetical protein
MSLAVLPSFRRKPESSTPCPLDTLMNETSVDCNRVGTEVGYALGAASP